MSDERQVLYYSRLTQLGVKKEISTTLSQVAEVMYTSTRHCRTLLKQMHDSGWIEWTPKVGRNQRSRLYLIYSLDKLKAELAQQLISAGKYEKALSVIDNDQTLFGQLLKNTSGPQRREGRLHVQLTYDRAFSPLQPHKPQRNSERFLLRQIYSCLTQCDENGIIKPDLAHHWTYDEEKLSWKFYLRPHLKFHDDNEINAAVVTELFKQLKQLPECEKELAHVKTVSELSSLCVEFILSEPDNGFAGLLSDIKYSIQPVDQISGPQPIVGSGIFQVQEHDKQRLTLQAFDNYHGFRALTDTVTIWQLPTQTRNTFGDTELQAGKIQTSGTICSSYLSVEGSSENATNNKQSRIEDGCLLAIVNHKANLSLLQRKYLSQLIATENLLSQLNNSQDKVEAEPAYNLLPNWLKLLPTATSVQVLPENLSIAIYDHLALKKCAEAISVLLKQAGVRCTTYVYSFEDLYSKASNHALREDLILTSMNLDDNRPVSAFCWMFSSPILHQSLPLQDKEWLENQLVNIRKLQPVTSYLNEIESVVSALISSNWLIPMFHHRQTLRFEGVLKSVSMNVWGWPEIRDVWTDE